MTSTVQVPLYLGNSLSGFGDGRFFTLSTEEKGQESTLALNPLTSGPGVRLMRERFSIFVVSISAEMGVML